MFKVTATANGYYGLKHRVPGEEFGIEKAEHFSIEWMDTDEAKVLAHVRERAKTKRDYAAWLENHKRADAPDTETRRVNTGGTDGVVGVELPKAGTKLSAKDRIALANSISGRTDVSAAEADTIIAAANASGGSANDDRSRDMASNPGDNAPAPDPLDHDADGKKGGAKKPAKADDGDI